MIGSRYNNMYNSNPLEIKGFVSGIFISFKCECHIIMQIQYTKNLSPGLFEFGTTLSLPNRSVIGTIHRKHIKPDFQELHWLTFESR